MTIPLLWTSFILSFTMYVLMKMFIAIGSTTMTVDKANMFNSFLIPSYAIPVSMTIVTLVFKGIPARIINLIFAILMGLVVINDLFGDMKRKSLTIQTAVALIFTLFVSAILVYFSITWLV